MSLKIVEQIQPKNRKEWRQWLVKNHLTQESVWLIAYKVSSKKSSVTWSETVEEALCFGWIDSIRRPIDHESYMQYYTKRKAKSIWSKINKNKVDQLIKDGLMTAAGMRSIEIAKKNGSWNSLDEVEELVVPSDLQSALDSMPVAAQFFEGLSKSAKKVLLHWITFAKRAETRQKRIDELVSCAAEKKKPKQFL